MAISIHDALNDVPNEATFSVDGEQTPPECGQLIVIDVDAAVPDLFTGTVITIEQVFEEITDQLRWDVTLLDSTWQLNAKRPFGKWEDVSATTIIIEVMTEFAPDFDTSHVEVGLPAVTIEFTGEIDLAGCLTALCQAAGGVHWKPLKFELWVFTDTALPAPDELNNTTNTTLIHNPPITMSEDIAQIRNRMWGKGAGVTVSGDAPAGSSRLQIEGLDLFDNSGRVIVGSQRLTYSGKDAITTAIDRGATPDASGFSASVVYQDESNRNANYFPTLGAGGTQLAYASGPIKGGRQYYIAFVDSELGESPLSTDGAGINTDAYLHFNGSTSTLGSPIWGYPYNYSYPPASLPYPTWEPLAPGGGGVYNYAFVWIVGGQADGYIQGAQVNAASPTTPNVRFNNLPGSGFPHANNLAIFRQGPDSHYHQIGSSPPSGGDFTDTVSSGIINSLPTLESVAGLPYVPFSPAQPGQTIHPGRSVRLYNIPTGPETTASRKIYAKDEGGPLYLLVTISDNVTDEYYDSKPLSNEEGEAPPETQYITRFYLSGIPSSGLGSIVKTIHAGETAQLFVMEEDLTAQQELAIKTGTDGVREDTFTDDNLVTTSAIRTRLRALLNIFSRSIKTIRYSTRDEKSITGATVVANLDDPPIHATLIIQDVIIDQINEALGLSPRYNVTASTMRFTFEDWVRKLRMIP
jgi:hypothetical protein